MTLPFIIAIILLVYPTIAGIVYRELESAYEADLPKPPPQEPHKSIGGAWPSTRCDGWKEILDEGRYRRRGWSRFYCTDCWEYAVAQGQASDSKDKRLLIAWAWPLSWLPWLVTRLFHAGSQLGQAKLPN